MAFLINPINNCYDESVIIANYGLGESVVGGQATPDRFVYDKVGGHMIETSIGKKEICIALSPYTFHHYSGFS